MRVLGLIMVRNSASTLESTLLNMQEYCDEIYAINDRSVDDTIEILRSHSLVTNVFSISPIHGTTPWLFGESSLLALLYQMADFAGADWIVSIDGDMTIAPALDIRHIISTTAADVSALTLRVTSAWRDRNYPDMVPLMGPATSRQTLFWRHSPHLRATAQWLHGPRAPINISERGQIEYVDRIVVHHQGWDTLEHRMEKARQYIQLDPDCKYNSGVPYDKGLLFGYTLDSIRDLVEEYQRRKSRHAD